LHPGEFSADKEVSAEEVRAGVAACPCKREHSAKPRASRQQRRGIELLKD